MKNKQVGVKKNNTIPHIIVMAFTILLAGIFISGTVSGAKNYYRNTHADYVQEYATIVRYESIRNRYNTGYTYTTYYEYEADGGVYYGMWQRLIYDEEEAKAQVGKKVRIYVDHNLKIHTKSLKFSTDYIWIAGTISLVSCLLFINSFVRETIYIVKWVKSKKSEDKKQSELN